MSDETNVNGSAAPATTEPVSETSAEAVADAKVNETSTDATNGDTESADVEADNAKESAEGMSHAYNLSVNVNFS